MDRGLYQLAEFSGRVAALGYGPMIALVIYVASRREVVDGIDFVQMDWVSLLTLFLSVLVFLLSAFWWKECGHGVLDACLGLAGIVPCLFVFSLLDPLGAAPILPH